MNPTQQKYYFVLWKDACVSQGWTKAKGWTTKDIDAQRKAIHTEVFGRPISSNEIYSEEDFGLIKNRFLLLADNLKGAKEDKKPQYDDARRYLWVIEKIQMPCLAVYVDHVPEYVKKVTRDKFKNVSDYRDLTAAPTNYGKRTSQLQQLLYTLSARLNAMRKEHGHSEHDNKIKAGIKCDCKECSSAPADTIHAPLEEEGSRTSAENINEPF